MNRSMKKELKLPLPEKKIGLSGHDFTEFFCKPNVILTYSETIDGKPVMMARWLNKLDAIKEINNIHFENPLQDKVEVWKDYFYNKRAKNFDRARFNPKGNEVFPETLSATNIEKWYQDPYTIFAKKILKLNKLDEINQIKNSEFGNIIHEGIKIFEEEKKSTKEDLYNIFILRSVKFSNLLSFNFWKIKFKDIAKYYIDFKNSIKCEVKKTYVEIEGCWKIPDTNLTITAKADRIDILNDGTAIIYDFKTGEFPSKKEVESGYYPQLLIEALILKHDGFKEIERVQVSNIKYIKLALLSACEITNAINSKTSLDDLLQETEINLIKAVKLFENNNQEYVSYPNPDIVSDNIKKYGEYNHLARVDDWLVLDDE